MTRQRLTLALLAGTAAPAAAQTQLWLRQFGTPQYDRARAVAADGQGGAFTAGHSDGALGGPYLGGGQDAWLARRDAAGNEAWKLQIGTGTWDDAFALAADSAGGVYIAGETWTSFGGPYAGVADVWLARYDAAGQRLWIRQYGGTGVDVPADAAPDAEGGVFVAGVKGLGTAGMAGSLVRYDSSGNQLWFRQFEESFYSSSCDAAAADGAGGVFVAGNRAVGANLFNHYLIRFDGQGNQLWLQLVGGTFYGEFGERVEGLAPDGAGGVYIAGTTGETLGGPNAGFYDAWLARYDGAGNQVWIRQFGTTTYDYAGGLAADGAGGVFIGGNTGGSLSGPTAGGDDVWLARYDTDGNQTWLCQFGSSADDYTYALSPNGTGGTFAAGNTFGSLGAPNAGTGDAWVARYAPMCYPNCDNSTLAPILNVNDYVCFNTAFAAGSSYANCDGSTLAPVLNVGDFICFMNKYAAGCS